MRFLLLALALSGCASAVPGVQTALADGQLACAVRSEHHDPAGGVM